MAIVPLLPKLRGNGSGHLVALIGVVVVMIGALRGYDVATIAGLWCVLAGLLLAARQGRAAVFARVPALTWLGEISYSYYMSFALVETFQATLWRRLVADPAQHPLVYILTTTAMTLAVATLSWRFVEQPSLRAFAAYARRRARRLSLAGAMAAPEMASRAAQR
jgi:peptidoglycan/LPS O-acetylase OafA/YrhL